jgi:hypothetical protein
VKSLVVVAVLAGSAHARPANVCIDVGVSFTPSEQLQIAGWVEDAQGHFIDTVYLTSKVGRYGIGNRPGRFDFNSGSKVHDHWPYGRRVTTFPVWAHRHGMMFPKIVFQDGDEDSLSHSFGESSLEDMPVFCGPKTYLDADFDAVTCPSPAYSDKGVFSATETSLYPPRTDLVRQDGDTPSVDMYRALNPFDAVTQATPNGGTQATFHWSAPPRVDYGDYVLFLEVSKAYDMNATYNDGTYPPPTTAFGDYGLPYRGQPSIVYATPFKIADTVQHATSAAYVGYGDPDGNDGVLRAPDATITTDTPGKGASRLQLTSDGQTMYRVKVDMLPGLAGEPPAAPDAMVATSIASTTATIAFVESPSGGRPIAYDIRVRALDDITADNFGTSMPVTATVAPASAGSRQTFTIFGLLPGTDYTVAVRGRDGCYQDGAIATTHFTTASATGSEVDACFIATAAYGSLMANDVELLRHVRDAYLSHTAIGELAIETYYTFGPAVAQVVAPSELLRQTARDALAPVVATIRLLAR